MALHPWDEIDDGEYNEQTTKVGDRVVTIYSDRDGETWDCIISGGEPFRLSATSKLAARREAEQEAGKP